MLRCAQHDTVCMDYSPRDPESVSTSYSKRAVFHVWFLRLLELRCPDLDRVTRWVIHTGGDLSGDEELSRSLEPCLMSIIGPLRVRLQFKKDRTSWLFPASASY